ncbi:MAG: undecaprenyl-diphosphate phosphatase [Bacteroidales bacterium]|nr:undecaprenyl-diphosphate phosphatase [Bacteroidales bacterium]MDZ4204374.1 undecaprenyl-diphosphate phosphatase [Bacteroidales bacterium]
MTWFEALILGLLQGLTEFFPISSSGHIEIGKVLFSIQSEDNLIFSVIVHAATMLSIIVIFYKDIAELIAGVLRFKWNNETKYLTLIVVSMVPVGIVGLLFEDYIEHFFEGRLVLVGFMLLITAALLLATRLSPKNIKELGFVYAIIIGISQTIAILPGISRSGATISTALLLGVERKKAIRFSFLMVLPPIAGATFIKITAMASEPTAYNADFLPLAIGFVAAFVAGLIACRWMIGLVQRGNIAWFSIYCVVVGALAIALGAFF